MIPLIHKCLVHQCKSHLGPESIWRWHLTSIGNPTMGFPILIRCHLYIDSGPGGRCDSFYFSTMHNQSIRIKQGHDWTGGFTKHVHIKPIRCTLLGFKTGLQSRITVKIFSSLGERIKILMKTFSTPLTAHDSSSVIIDNTNRSTTAKLSSFQNDN